MHLHSGWIELPLVEQMQERLETIEGFRVSVQTLQNGPPVEDFPFAAQINVDAASLDAGQALADDETRDAGASWWRGPATP